MPAPTSVGRLLLQRPIGSGGFATVWLAEDPELDTQVAVKVLADNWASNADVRRRFVDEARLLRRMDSDHLVRVYDIGELPDGRPYFVMSYADGGTLTDRLHDRPAPWPPGDVLQVVDDLAAALSLLHRHGIVHRDVKPSNVLFQAGPPGHGDGSRAQRILLGDLGIAKDLQWASGLTLPAGSPAFMAPEQRDAFGRVSPASDVHAFAMTAARLLDLDVPWPASPLGDTLRRATAQDPAQRTASAATFATELRTALEPWLVLGADPATGTPHRTSPDRAPPDRTLPDRTPPTVAASMPVTTVAAPTTAPTVGVPTAAAPTATPVSEPTPGRRRRRTRFVVVAVTALSLATGLAVWSGLRDRRLTPTDGGASVSVPHDWTQAAGVPFPGDSDAEADADDGIRAGAAGRTIAVAFASSHADPAAVLAEVAVTGCAAPTIGNVMVGPWTGVTWRYAGCAGGAVVDEVVLANEGTDEWTVWVEVRSVDGDPDLERVLSSLRVPS